MGIYPEPDLLGSAFQKTVWTRYELLSMLELFLANFQTKKAMAPMTAVLPAIAMPMIGPVPRLESEGWEAGVDDVLGKAEVEKMTGTSIVVRNGELLVLVLVLVLVVLLLVLVLVVLVLVVLLLVLELLVLLLVSLTMTSEKTGVEVVSGSWAATMHDNRRGRKTLAVHHFIFVGGVKKDSDC